MKDSQSLANHNGPSVVCLEGDCSSFETGVTLGLGSLFSQTRVMGQWVLSKQCLLQMHFQQLLKKLQLYFLYITLLGCGLKKKN